MSKIKVTVNSISQANEIIEYWGDKEVELLVEVKENTTAENSYVFSELRSIEKIANEHIQIKEYIDHIVNDIDEIKSARKL